MIVNKIRYSFDDEVVTMFCYDSRTKRIVVTFEGCYADEAYINEPCNLIIENWKSGKSRLHGEKKYVSLESHLSIFSLILSLEGSSNTIELIVNTLDDKYLELLFEQPTIRVEHSNRTSRNFNNCL